MPNRRQGSLIPRPTGTVVAPSARLFVFLSTCFLNDANAFQPAIFHVPDMHYVGPNMGINPINIYAINVYASANYAIIGSDNGVSPAQLFRTNPLTGSLLAYCRLDP